jgi:nitrate reductase NapE component
MKDDDETEDLLFSFVFVAVTILTVLFAVASVGLIVWSWL